ncbi:low affinity immunoglobulin epsilon Fc receptor [Lingula anatina]|uniref:Low affinity immunoglobulin epsilon Fc receptor n=1 Tax=Lingula anatina TaxID=7574 RepID=A0A1S3JA86_LINAN|nr:low affinity immunoglobulin epsilon Fc receptor [Lingula anatina]XP_013406786.1 low affinity immunoglobulin epsilon Fc receptor [Lingula anatina]XP_013406787.1 low affinity immunoglobulin epsilon Fc receptor [Lingula anatina]XP_013406788.1 low affinity immunoglobulin epsilon Fc receptor [Lingula anatina]XP_013406790.1 low affinity immunoglobulin epsilon Fc receptor [Lingula anatina]XP_013406791.1 low affinity immunoglobulin epsilon Fc receptor [Lingula anatina]XP_013406792.1 low affinity i|eukprot:XP_013406785.1 low affinity immunoglobulin epsilon Fc receptor [Lingula anatina]
MEYLTILISICICLPATTLSQSYSRADNEALPKKRGHQEKLNQLNSLMRFQGDQCSMLLNVQDFLLDLYNDNRRYKKKTAKLQKTVDKMANEMKQLREIVDQLRSGKMNIGGRSQADSGYLYDQSPTSVRGGQDTSQIMRIVHEMTDHSRNMTHAMLSRTEHKYRVLERKMDNLQEISRQEANRFRSKEAEIRKMREENHKKARELVKQQDTIVDMEKRIHWLESTANRGNDIAISRGDSACPEGFLRYARSCYRFGNTTVTWLKAEETCQSLDPRAHLVGVESKEENDFLIAYRKYNAEKWSSSFFWSGGNDLHNEGTWTWVGTGKPLTFTFWLPGEPNSFHQHQDCMYFTGDGEHRWDDWNCHSLKINYVCEIILEGTN